jgi:glycine/D-amino acid oxidase-like deaminating enzyme
MTPAPDIVIIGGGAMGSSIASARSLLQRADQVIE